MKKLWSICLLVALSMPLQSLGDYGDDWGPEVGSQLPNLAAYDHEGMRRTLEDLAGERGLLLLLSRSADW